MPDGGLSNETSGQCQRTNGGRTEPPTVTLPACHPDRGTFVTCISSHRHFACSQSCFPSPFLRYRHDLYVDGLCIVIVALQSR
ncbi:hypothetical protein E2C01_068024 [Portunus trituberculatus]|uniref:Uncharacterized protein n=1 Tax=Portunus trituberculatus TaxID=210409 RepID=A0A5B7HWT0_PORTR|nr:hypothetical protein [Portunus trituberculatus]